MFLRCVVSSITPYPRQSGSSSNKRVMTSSLTGHPIRLEFRQEEERTHKLHNKSIFKLFRPLPLSLVFRHVCGVYGITSLDTYDHPMLFSLGQVLQNKAVGRFLRKVI